MLIQCPSCASLLSVDDPDDMLNYIIDRVYTDGRVVCTPLCSSDLLARCPNCGFIVRMPESAANFVPGTVWQRLFSRRAFRASARDYLEAAETGLARSQAEHLAFRIEAWRIANDAYRDVTDRRKPSPEDQPDWWKNNLQELTRLFDRTDFWQSILRAEALRELGVFSACLEQIRAIEDQCEQYDLELDAIRRFAIERNPHVKRIRTKDKKRRRRLPE